MLETYFVKPQTVDRIRACWIGAEIERYAGWLSEQGYSTQTVLRRVPALVAFGEFARLRGASVPTDLPAHVDAFVAMRVASRAAFSRSAPYRKHDGGRAGREPARADGTDGPLQHAGRAHLPACHARARRGHRKRYGPATHGRQEDQQSVRPIGRATGTRPESRLLEITQTQRKMLLNWAASKERATGIEPA
jgi:hypothetical protein